MGEQISAVCRIDNYRRLCWHLSRNRSHGVPVTDCSAVRRGLSEYKRVSIVCQVDSLDANIGTLRDLELFGGRMVVDQGGFVVALTLDTLSLVDTLFLVL